MDQSRSNRPDEVAGAIESEREREMPPTPQSKAKRERERESACNREREIEREFCLFRRVGGISTSSWGAECYPTVSSCTLIPSARPSCGGPALV